MLEVPQARLIGAVFQELDEARKEVDEACAGLMLALVEARATVARIRARQAAIRQECREIEAMLALAGGAP